MHRLLLRFKLRFNTSYQKDLKQLMLGTEVRIRRTLHVVFVHVACKLQLGMLWMGYGTVL